MAPFAPCSSKLVDDSSQRGRRNQCRPQPCTHSSGWTFNAAGETINHLQQQDYTMLHQILGFSPLNELLLERLLLFCLRSQVRGLGKHKLRGEALLKGKKHWPFHPSFLPLPCDTVWRLDACVVWQGKLSELWCFWKYCSSVVCNGSLVSLLNWSKWIAQGVVDVVEFSSNWSAWSCRKEVWLCGMIVQSFGNVLYACTVMFAHGDVLCLYIVENEFGISVVCTVNLWCKP